MKDSLQLGLEALLLKARTDKDTFIALKSAAVAAQHFELAADFRTLEKELFPETEEEKKVKEDTEKFNLLFRMMGINIDNKTSWLIGTAMVMYLEKNTDITLMDTAKIEAFAHKFFK